VPIPERPLGLHQLGSLLVIDREAGQLDLDADEGGTVGVAVLFQPVGIHQARGIIVRGGEDGSEKGVGVVRHAIQLCDVIG
jgi:hypothetical protein